MSQPERTLQNFLQRWSRRKLAAAEHAGESADAQAKTTESAEAHSGGGPSPESDIGVFDPRSLPPIDSIGAASDLRPFLAPGVPVELTRAALRRAWVSDPAIRDFVGLAENQWDFTKPDGVPGFASLELSPELRRMLAGFVGQAPADGARASVVDTPAAPASAENYGKTGLADPAATALPQAALASPVVAAPLAMPSDKETAATQGNLLSDGSVSPPAPRKHGSALPK